MTRAREAAVGWAGAGSRPALLISLVALVAPLAVGCPQRAAPSERPPDILLVLTDDQRADTLSCYGNDLVETPALDRLAAEGTLFEQAFASSALCCPSRASLLTGLYPHRLGIHDNQPEGPFPGDAPFLPRLLQRAGYETALFGKWHLPNPGAAPIEGFDHWVSFEGQGEYVDQELVVDGARVPTPGFSSDALTERALRWLDRERARPVFVMLSLKNCHKPFDAAPQRFQDELAGVDVPLPESYGDPPESLPPHLRRRRERESPRKQAAEDGTVGAELRGYLALGLSVDESVGRLLELLERRGELDRTFVVFTSDHGILWGEHGLFQKRSGYDPAIRVPLLVRYPPLARAGAREERLVLGLDLTPTLLELAGAPLPETLQGASLLPLLRGEDVPWRASTLHVEAFQPRFERPEEYAVRTQRWKYLRAVGRDPGEALFDLRADPDERVDLSGDARHAGELERLRAELLELLSRSEAPREWLADLTPSTGGGDG